MVDGDDPRAANPAFLTIAGQHISGQILYVDAYTVEPSEWPGPGGQIEAHLIEYLVHEIARPHRLHKTGRPGQELVVVTPEQVGELQTHWRAGEGWTSTG